MSEHLNKLFSSEMDNINTINNMNEFNLSPNITYYKNNSFNSSFLDITQLNNLNESLMNNEGAQHPMDDGNDDEPQSDTPKMNINFNSNDQTFNENINHETPQKEKNISKHNHRNLKIEIEYKNDCGTTVSNRSQSFYLWL